LKGISVIAGNGVLPGLVAAGARKAGVRVCMVSHVGETDPKSEAMADEVERVRVGQLGKVLKAMGKFGYKEVAFAGGLKKVGLLSGAMPDIVGLMFLSGGRDRKDDSMLRKLAALMESRGYEVIACTRYCPELLVPRGNMGRRSPERQQVLDGAYGMRLLDALSDFSTGQAVVVNDGTVLAVEAVEGTDAMIDRVASMKLKGAVLVKAAKKGQDPRFDIPAIGPLTLPRCDHAGISAIILEAGRTMLLGRDETMRAADRCGISISGVDR
jgi:hypothetical protein